MHLDNFIFQASGSSHLKHERTVYEGYKLDVVMNMNVQQFLNGLEESAKQKVASYL